jgi:rhodanese-related sulfurtransferase
MMKIKAIILQAVALGVIGTSVGFVFNAFSANGINPFRKASEVPLVSENDGNDVEGSEGIKFISLSETRDMIKEGAAIIDSRNPEDYREGHIPGAHLLSYYYMGDYMDRVFSMVSPEMDIILYCHSRTCEDSEMLARELYLMEYKNLFVFKGGFETWRDEGLPVEKGEY